MNALTGIEPLSLAVQAGRGLPVSPSEKAMSFTSKLVKLHPQIKTLTDSCYSRIDGFRTRLFDRNRHFPNSCPPDEQVECWTQVFREMATALRENKVDHWPSEELANLPKVEIGHIGECGQILWELLVTAVDVPESLQAQIEVDYSIEIVRNVLATSWMWVPYQVDKLVNRFALECGPCEDFSNAFANLLKSNNISETNVLLWLRNHGPSNMSLNFDLWNKVQSAWNPFRDEYRASFFPPASAVFKGNSTENPTTPPGVVAAVRTAEPDPPARESKHNMAIDLGFDLQIAGKKALEFVEAVERSGWVDLPGPDQILDGPDRNFTFLITPLAEWERAINPERMPFEELDKMERIWAFCSNLKTIDEKKTLIPALVLVAAFGWVARFWKAESLCQSGEWMPKFPFKFLPFELVETIWQAAKAIESGKNIPEHCYPPRHQKAKVSLAESHQHAIGIVNCASDIRRNLTSTTGIDLTEDLDLFRLWGHLNWHDLLLPGGGYEPCETTAFRDGGISGTCAHDAAKRLRESLCISLGFYAMNSRNGPASRCFLHCSWMIPFWTPQARCDAAQVVPKIDQGYWRNELTIEARKLAKLIAPPTVAAGKPTAKRDSPAVNSDQQRMKSGGRIKLADSKKPADKAKLNVYQLILKAKLDNPSFSTKDLIQYFKYNKDFATLVKAAGLSELKKTLIRAAVEHGKYNASQETQSGMVS